jgi:excisionase family DNA binding protein
MVEGNHPGGAQMTIAPPPIGAAGRPYTATEVAAALGVHRKTVRRWLGDGRLKGFKLPGHPQQRWYVTQEEMERIRSGEAMAAWQAEE